MISINDIRIEPGKFPDGTLHLLYDDFDKNNDTLIHWQYENNEELVILMFLTKHLRAHGINNISLYMPYIPNARQDRVKEDKDVFTLKYFAQIINDLNFNWVRVLDPHSSVSEALINNIIIDTPKACIDKTVDSIAAEFRTFTPDEESNSMIAFYPDEGAMKRYSGLLDLPYAFGIKKRNWKTGIIEGLDVVGSTELIAGNDVLIIDDICSRGGTFYHSAKKLKELGADNIYLYITHCEDTIFEGKIFSSGLIKKVYTTDSIFTKPTELIEIIPTWSTLIGEGVSLISKIKEIINE